MDQRAGGGLPEAKTANMRRAGTPYAKIGGPLRTGSGRIQLRDRSNVKPEGRTKPVAPGGILLHNPLRNREELRHWRTYLAGAPHQIVIHTDHSNLLYWKEPRKISRRIAREFQELQEYNFV